MSSGILGHLMNWFRGTLPQFLPFDFLDQSLAKRFSNELIQRHTSTKTPSKVKMRGRLLRNLDKSMLFRCSSSFHSLDCLIFFPISLYFFKKCTRGVLNILNIHNEYLKSRFLCPRQNFLNCLLKQACSLSPHLCS